MNVWLGSINVNNVTSNSGIFVGSNIQMNWRHNGKTNIGLGNTTGKNNIITNNQNVVYDNDLIDMPINNSPTYS